MDISFLDGLLPNHFCSKCYSNNQIDYEPICIDDIDEKYFLLGKCHICNKAYFFVYSEPPRDPNVSYPTSMVSGGTTYVELKYVYPISIPEISKDLPLDIAKTYEEGISCLNSNAPNGAVSVFRRTLQKICIDKGATQGDNLADQIAVLSSDLQTEAFELKQWGNIGAHPDKIIPDVPSEDAKEMKGFLKRVIYVMYELPAKLDRSKNTRNGN